MKDRVEREKPDPPIHEGMNLHQVAMALANAFGPDGSLEYRLALREAVSRPLPPSA